VKERVAHSILCARFWFHIKKLRNFFHPNLLKIREFIDGPVERRWRPSTRLCIKRTGNYIRANYLLLRDQRSSAGEVEYICHVINDRLV
jgi:hypothetical protein